MKEPTFSEALTPSFTVVPWPRGHGGPQVMVRRFVEAARQRRYQVAPLPLIAKRQPCLLNIGHVKQEMLLDSPRAVVYRVAGMFLEDHFERLAATYQDRIFKPEFAQANQRIREMLMRADFVIYQSLFSKQYLDRLHTRPEGSWAIIPNGICLAHFSPQPDWSGRAASVPVLGTVGSMRYRPRLDVFFDVARRLSVRPHLLVIGAVDSFCRARLDQALEDPYWRGAIEYVPSISPRQLVHYYRRMDCLVHTVAADSCPNVVVEALACGVPVVCPLEGGTVELIGTAGVAVADADPISTYTETLRAGMAQGVEEVLGNLPAMRRQARLQAEAANDIHGLVPRYLNALGFPPFGPESGWKYRATRVAGQVVYPLSSRLRSTKERQGRPRIGLVLWDWNLGGIASWMFRLAHAMPEFEFHFIATHLQAHANRCDEVGRFAYTPSFASLVRYFQQQRMDLVQVSNNRWPVDAARVAGVKKIIERTDGTRSCCALSKGDLDWVIVSAAGTQPFIRRFWPHVPTTVIHNSVDLLEVDAMTPPAGPTGAKPVVIGRCSRFGRGKRLDLLIDAVAILLQRGREVQLLLAGEDSRLPGAIPVEPSLRQRAIPLGERVHFLGRIENPLQLSHGFDIAVCCSDPFNEGIPNSLIEPMSCGKPVVATRVDQVDELVDDGVNGFLVPSGDAMSLADALDRLVVDAPLRVRMGQAARRTIEERFSFDAALAQYRALYGRLLHGS